MATVRNLEFVQGDTFEQGFTVSNLDLSGWSLRGQVRHVADDPDPTATFEIIIDDAAAGQFTARLDPADTAGMIAQRYVYDVEIYDAEDVYTVVRGNLTLAAEVTRT